MKLLFFTYHILDGVGGGCFASKAYINAFAEIAESMTLLFPSNDGKDIVDINDMIHQIPIFGNKNRLKKMLNLVRGRLHRFFDYKKYICFSDYDMVVFDTSMSSYKLLDEAKKSGCVTICIHHNYQYEYYKDNTNLPLSIPLLYWCKKIERDALTKSDVNLTISTQDKKLLLEHYDNVAPIEVIGCFEYKKEEKIMELSNKKRKNNFLITGNLSARETEISLLNWLAEYFPILCKMLNQVNLTIAGKNPSQKLKEICSELGVNLIESPLDMKPIIMRADYYICPTSLGGGLKLRVMDGLKFGLPILAHDISARGYDVFKGKCLFTYSNSQTFGESLLHLCSCNYDRVEIEEMYKNEFSFVSGVERLKSILIGRNLLDNAEA